MRRRYEELRPITRADFLAAQQSDDSWQRGQAILRLALYDGEPTFIERACLALLADQHDDVRRAAVTSIGHLARIHGSVADETRSSLDELLATDPQLAGDVVDVLEDIERFAR